jgi:hypothetical protein
VALLVPVGNLDGLVQLAFAQRARHSRGEQPRLLAGRVEGQDAVNHHADGPGGHAEQDDHHDLGHQAHLVPQRADVPTYGRLLQQQKRPDLQL